MNPIKRLGLIIAVALAVDAAVYAPAFPQQDEAATLMKRGLRIEESASRAR